MPNFNVQGNKTVYCKHGHLNIIPFQDTMFICTTCHETYFVYYTGTVIDKKGNYLY
jgi:hypothetical protein